MSIFKREKKIDIKPQVDVEQIKKEARESAIEQFLDGKISPSGFYLKGTKDERSALSLSAIWCAVELISNSIALMPIDIKRKDKISGNAENDKDHYLNNVFNNKANTIVDYLWKITKEAENEQENRNNQEENNHYHFFHCS